MLYCLVYISILAPFGNILTTAIYYRDPNYEVLSQCSMLSSSNPKWKTKFFTPPFLVPGAPPSMVNAYPESSSSLRIVWEPPPENKQNGIISYYKIFIVPKTRSDSEATVIEIKNPRAREFVIDELLKWTQYRIWMLAGTSVGDGPKSAPIDIKTDEDGRYLFYDK